MNRHVLDFSLVSHHGGVLSVFPVTQGESFREVMRRIQTMLDIQEKEFEKVCSRLQYKITQAPATLCLYLSVCFVPSSSLLLL